MVSTPTSAPIPVSVINCRDAGRNSSPAEADSMNELSRRLWLTNCFLGLAGCKSAQQSLPMPAQRRSPCTYLKFNQADADDCIVRDITPGNESRWTRDHPELKFFVPRQPGLRFS